MTAAAAPRLRPACLADVDALVALENLFPGDRLSRRSWRHLLRAETAWIRVVEDSRLQVLANVVCLRRHGSRWWRIYSLVVAPAARGQGLARALMLQAMDAVRNAGAHGLRLEVRADNLAAIGLYAGLGFHAHRRLPGYYDDGTDGLTMRWTAAAAGAAVRD